MKTSEKQLRTSQEILAEIRSYPRHVQLMRLTIRAGKNRLSDLRSKVLTHCMTTDPFLNLHEGSDSNHIEMREGVFASGMTHEFLFAPLAAQESVMAVLEGCPMHKNACEKLDPLHRELLEAEAAEAAELALASQAKHQLEEAKEIARAAFEASIDTVPVVQAAAKKVEPYLRRGILVAD